MLSIESILKFIATNLSDSARFNIIDDEHVLDLKTGVKLHLYDDWFKATRDDVVLAKMSDFAPHEQELIWQIKQAITDPSKAKKKQDNHQAELKERRELLSMSFEVPEPIIDKSPIVEADTTEYTG